MVFNLETLLKRGITLWMTSSKIVEWKKKKKFASTSLMEVVWKHFQWIVLQFPHYGITDFSKKEDAQSMDQFCSAFWVFLADYSWWEFSNKMIFESN